MFASEVKPFNIKAKWTSLWWNSQIIRLKNAGSFSPFYLFKIFVLMHSYRMWGTCWQSLHGHLSTCACSCASVQRRRKDADSFRLFSLVADALCTSLRNHPWYGVWLSCLLVESESRASLMVQRFVARRWAGFQPTFSRMNAGLIGGSWK